MLFVSPSGGVCDPAGPHRSPFWSSRRDQPRRLWAAPASGSRLRVSLSSEAVVGKESRGSRLCLAAPAFPGSVHPKSSKLPGKPAAGPIPPRHCFSLVILIKNSAWHPSSYRRKPQSLCLALPVLHNPGPTRFQPGPHCCPTVSHWSGLRCRCLVSSADASE